ncbi:hypothetical protein PDESU_04448 [Pontiella desulfatans]|uniref:Uncharacterized protein n=1 Tax=Pontiella desulfatans TaxID=2750659 RepID=A0A6C2U8N2_PONDE|nr:hypothetical protein [Pontiella desulfatans]VGO15861.1 hypothetical protein PDESU_04448 [Pontiella desulfatans]
MSNDKFTHMKFTTVALSLATAMVFLSGCQTAKTTPAPEDAAEEGAVTQTEEAGPVGRSEMTVKVEGATSSQSGDTLTINYPVMKDKNALIPDWVINPAIGGVVGAVGVSSPKGLGVREQLDEARLSGRIELASMLETRLQTVGRSELEDNALATGEGRSENSRRSSLAVDRDIMDIVLAGSRQRALWFDPVSDECFVWMVLDGGVLTKSKHYVVDGLSVFISNQPIKSEYKPERKKPVVPQVTVEAPEPLPPEEKEPVEKLEESLKPIQNIPINPEE